MAVLLSYTYIPFLGRNFAKSTIGRNKIIRKIKAANFSAKLKLKNMRKGVGVNDFSFQYLSTKLLRKMG